uniref:Uncharacterized protein n=1 Tax=Timema genevievae TaxID=629358 RepID=A0A7R9PQQ7_TIMGE|nr:unnamed protein product [Timema genevievae]
MSLISECEGKKGLLGALLAEKIDHTYVVRIVADLVMAAGDTVSTTLPSSTPPATTPHDTAATAPTPRVTGIPTARVYAYYTSEYSKPESPA